MAYDLLFKKQIPFNCAMGSSLGLPNSGPLMNGITKLFVVGGAAAIIYGILRKTKALGENQQLRQLHASDNLDVTQDLPAMTMADLMRQGG